MMMIYFTRHFTWFNVKSMGQKLNRTQQNY